MIFDPQAKLLWHGDKVKNWLTTGKASPILVEIAPTGYCNANCPWCFFQGKLGKEKIDRGVLLRTLSDFSKLGLEAVNWSGGGEPTLHPNFSEFVLEANRLGFKQGLFTNGYQEIPHQDKFSWIRVSLTNQGFDPIIKPTVKFGICLNHILSYTEDSLNSICKQAKDFGASYFQVRPALMGGHKKQPILTPPLFLKKNDTRNFKVYVTEYKYDQAIKPKTYKDCYGYHFCPSVDWHGKLSVCLYLTLEQSYILGDLNKESLLDLWTKLPKKANVISNCQNCCKNHEINKILFSTKNIKSESFL